MPALHAALHQHFGFDAFRHGQHEALQHVLAGRDTLVVMPTGSGKSLIYQLAALQLPGLTLVVSPLVALMKDQADSLARRGLPATFINSSLDPAEQARRLRGLAERAYKIVLVAPERFRSRLFRQALAQAPLSLFTLDEAHCLSQWGHDFRPDYLQLAQVRRDFQPPVTLALTATATPQVQDDILRLLGLSQSARLVTGFNRPNLTFEVVPVYQASAKLDHLRRLLAELPGAGLIYTGTRKEAEEVALFIRRTLKRPAEHYHAALDPAERSRVQDDFIAGRLPLVVATNAFGMGIDRPDVRFVIHYTLPGTLEAYYQEAGRAGRDGQPARAILLYAANDLRLHHFFIDSAAPSPQDLRAVHRYVAGPGAAGGFRLEDLQNAIGLSQVKARVALEQLESGGLLQVEPEAGVLGERRAQAQPLSEAALRAVSHAAEQRAQHRRAQLARIAAYAEAAACRRRRLLDHFGDTGPTEAPACCDICLSEQAAAGAAAAEPAQPASTRAERAALVVLDTVAALKWPLGRRRLAQLLKGSQARGMENYTGARNYGRLSSLPVKDVDDLLLQLLTSGHLKLEGAERPVLRLTPLGESALAARAALPVDVPSLRQAEARERRVAAAPGPSRDRGSSLSAGPTVHVTGDLFDQGRTPEQIAQARGLTLRTVYDHLAQLIAEGRLAVDRVVPAGVQAQVRAAIAAAGSHARLAPLKARLPANIDYDQIRCVVSAVEREQAAAAPPLAAPGPNRAAQVHALGQGAAPGDATAVAQLIAGLDDPSGNVRRLAASALGKLRLQAGVQPLLALLEREPGPQVRQYALKALGRIGDPQARTALERIAADPAERDYNRQAAQEALKTLRRPR